MKIAGPVATAMGQSLESVTGVTAFLGGTGIKGSQAATALKNAFLKLASPSTTAAKMLQALGVQVADSDGNMRDLNDIIGDLAPKLKTMGNVKAAKVLDEIFGKRAIAGAINIGEGTKAIKEFQKSLRGAQGTAQLTADRMRQSLGNRLKALGSAATEFGFKIFEAFEVRGEDGITTLTEAIRGFDPQPIINGLENIITTAKVLYDVIAPIAKGIATITRGLGMAAADIVRPFVDSGPKGPTFDELQEKHRTQPRTAPNEEVAQARAQGEFRGRLDIAGVPKGSTLETENTGAAQIDVALMGP
jgi:TP901 family phage tail tape measure protein